MDIFLSFDLCITSCIFNLFVEILHWIFEILYEWNVIYYLDDFLFIFFSNMNIIAIFIQFDNVFAKFDLTKIIEKNSDNYIIMHLKFEFDSENM